jgi:protein-S-isoprenylcysteine O-methyltransferase Ste14
MLLFGTTWFVLLPMLLLRFSDQFPPTPRSLPWISLGCALFVLGAALSWFAAYHLVVFGRGTPFPLDPTRELVTSGPYSYVRNPQAIATGIIVLGEIAAMRSTALVWLLPATIAFLELLAAPYENRSLIRRFGDAYVDYRSRVPKWIPSRRASLR